MTDNRTQPLLIFDREKFPEWVDDDALLELESVFSLWGISELGDYESVDSPEWLKAHPYLKTYLSLFTNKEMEYCWQRVKKGHFKPSLTPHRWLALVFWDALPNPQPRTTRKDANDWKDSLLTSLKRTRDLAKETPINMRDWNANALEKLERESLGFFTKDMLDSVFPHPQNLLDIYIDSLEITEYDPLNYCKHVNSKNADRNFFIRSLTSSLFHDFGQPLRPLVKVATSVAFDCNISEREIRNVSKGITLDNAQRSFLVESKINYESVLEEFLSTDPD